MSTFITWEVPWSVLEMAKIADAWVPDHQDVDQP